MIPWAPPNLYSAFQSQLQKKLESVSRLLLLPSQISRQLQGRWKSEHQITSVVIIGLRRRAIFKYPPHDILILVDCKLF